MKDFSRRSFIGAGLAVAAAAATPTSMAQAATSPTIGASPDAVASARRLIRTHLGQRASLVTKQPQTKSADALGSVFVNPSQYGDKQGAVVARGKLLSNDYGGYAASRTVVDVVSVGTSTPTSLSLVVQERTALAFAKVGDPSCPEELYAASHQVDLVRTAGGWRIAAIQYLPEYACFIPITQLPSDTPAGTPNHPTGASPTPIPAGMPGPATSGVAVKSESKGTSGLRPNVAASYNYTAMVNYAAAWYYRNNPAYVTYPDDCTSFVSQCVRAGGWETVGGFLWQRTDDHYWFPAGAVPASYSWAGAQNWRNFGYYAGRWTGLSSAYSCGTGDALGYDFDRNGSLDHLQLSTSNNGGNPLMTQHSPGYYGRPLSQIIAGTNWALYPMRT